jgi:hypothetical protein
VVIEEQKLATLDCKGPVDELVTHAPEAHGKTDFSPQIPALSLGLAEIAVGARSLAH